MPQKVILAIGIFFMITSIVLAIWLALERARNSSLFDDYMKASKKSLDFVPLRAKIEKLERKVEEEKNLRIAIQEKYIEDLKAKLRKK